LTTPRLYVAGPLFSEGERTWLDQLAARLRSEGYDCFVPHENFAQVVELTPQEVYRVDGDGLRSANALVAWLDGPMVDDGTAAEIGAFAELVRSGDPDYRGIVGIVTDLRLERRRGNAPGDGMNLFVVGAIESCGRICWSVDEAVAALAELMREESGRAEQLRAP
jgi:Nucleoside 2-deoxyribosyltransferase